MKIKAKIIFSSLITLVLALFSCASNPPPSVSHESEIIDWKDKELGQVEKPAWVMQLKWGNDRPFKDSFGIEFSRVCRLGDGQSIDLSQAQTLSRTDASSKIARELRQAVTARIASEVDDGELLAINEAMVSAQVSISGLREEESHWWLVRRWDEKAKKFYTEYEYCTAFSMTKQAWDDAVKSYLISVMASEGISKESQEKIGATYSTISQKAHREDGEMKAEQESVRSILSERLGDEAGSSFLEEDSLEALLK